MPKRNGEKVKLDRAETSNIHISIREIKENTQITVKDTGWGEEEKERMKQHGYDSLDMVRAWYS